MDLANSRLFVLPSSIMSVPTSIQLRSNSDEDGAHRGRRSSAGSVSWSLCTYRRREKACGSTLVDVALKLRRDATECASNTCTSWRKCTCVRYSSEYMYDSPGVMSGFDDLVRIISTTLISRSRVDFCHGSHLQHDILVEVRVEMDREHLGVCAARSSSRGDIANTPIVRIGSRSSNLDFHHSNNPTLVLLCVHAFQLAPRIAQQPLVRMYFNAGQKFWNELHMIGIQMLVLFCSVLFRPKGD